VGGHQGRAEVLAGDARIKANLGHIHALAGAFDLFGQGNHLAVSPGYGMREGRNHSTLSIEDADQRLDPACDANLVCLDFGPDYAYLAGEAADCYPPEVGLRKFRRHVAWLAPDTFVIADDLALAKPSAAGKATTWRLDYDTERNNVSIKPMERSFLVAPKDAGGAGALAVRLLAPSAAEMEKADLKPAGASWIACGQVRASVRDLFKDSPAARFLAVLSVLSKASAAPPAVREVSGPGVIGAVVDSGGKSRAAVFVTAPPQAEGNPLTFEVPAAGDLACLVFSLPGDSSYEARAAGRRGSGGQITYLVTLRKGPGAKTNSAGTLAVPGRPPE
jgi:hypothetical protein